MPRQNMLESTVHGSTGGGGYRRFTNNSRNTVNTDASRRMSSLARKTPSLQSAREAVTSDAVLRSVNKKLNSGGTPAGAAAGASAGLPSNRNNAPTVYRPPDPLTTWGRDTATGQASSSAVTDWIDQLRSEIGSGGGSPDLSSVDSSVEKLRNQITPNSSPNLPDYIDPSDYYTEMATINDIANKYGFDYSREYAEQQAEVIAQAQRDEIASSRERQQYELESAQTDLEHDFFNEYLQQRQGLVDSGLNAGIAAERDVRLGMNMQHAMSDILANNQLYNQELDRRLSTISAEEAAYADRLYNERLQQGFGNAMDYSRFEQSENQWQAQMAMQQRNQMANEAWRGFEFNNMSASEREQFLQRERQMGYENAWREYEFNNMSASERARLVADAERFGMEQAWDRHRFDAEMAFDAAYSGFNDGSGGGGAASGQAQSVAQQMGLRMTSSYRSPEENARVGGHPNSSHMTGRAMDFAGSQSQMNQFANWARNSGLYKNVLWQVPGHYDHVHVDW